ncbi:MAG: SMC-Scp complex subunit ScpB [Candidatus Hodarchaeota archaeon]
MNNSNENLDDNLSREPDEVIEEISEDLDEELDDSSKIEKSNGESEVFSEDEIIEELEEIETEPPMIEKIDSSIEDESVVVEELDEESLKRQVREFHRNLIEASLYAAGRPLTIEELSTKLELPKKEVEELTNEVAYDYLDRSTALIIAQIGDRYQMQIRPEYTEKVSKFAKGGAIAERYLRTLTVIALKQPILKSTVIKLRGTGAYEHVKYLLDNGFINAVKKGRSQELTTTDKYADMFGLPKNISQLKKVMVTQLGVEEEGKSEQLSEEKEE